MLSKFVAFPLFPDSAWEWAVCEALPFPRSQALPGNGLSPRLRLFFSDDGSMQKVRSVLNQGGF